MPHPQVIRRKAHHWADQIAHVLKLLPAPQPVFVRFVPKDFREEVELELLTRYDYVVTSWGNLVLSPGIHHLGPCQLIEFRRESSPEPIIPETNEEDEDEEWDYSSQDMFPLLLAFFAVILLMATSMWIGNF